MGWVAANPAVSGRSPTAWESAGVTYRITLIVNDEKFLICSKLRQIELFEAEFNIELFILAEFNSLNEAD